MDKGQGKNNNVLKPGFISRKVSGARYFFLNLAPDAPGPLNVACGGRETSKENYKIARRDFPYYAIEFVVKGRGRLNLNDRRFTLASGAVFTYGPDIPHEIVTRQKTPLTKYFIDFSGEQAAALLEKYSLGPGKMVWVSEPETVAGIYEQMLENGRMHTQYSFDICRKLLELLVIKIAENFRSQSEYHSPAYQTYLRCCSCLEENAHDLYSLSDIAKVCYIDRSYLCRIFKRFSNFSPYQKLLRLKMGRAAERLMNSDELIKQIAIKLGFSDPYHFSHSFKRVYGVSPSDFRKMSRKHYKI